MVDLAPLIQDHSIHIPRGQVPTTQPNLRTPGLPWPQSQTPLPNPDPLVPADLPAETQDIFSDYPTDGNLSNFAASNTQPGPLSSNRHAWFDRSKYNKITNGDLVRYVHRTAGRVLRKETTPWRQQLESRLKEHPNKPYYPFASEAQWKLGHWLATSKSSQSKIDEFLEMDGVLAETPSYNRASTLFEMVEDRLDGFGGPEWHSQHILPENFPDGRHEDLVLYHRNIEECADYLVGRPDLAGGVSFAPEVILAGQDEIQIVNQMPTGRLWHKILEKANQDADAALGGILFGSDTTHLTHYAGDLKVHALYLSLGNIHKEVRAQTSKRAWILVAYIPICKWENTLEKTELKSKAHEKALPGILSRRLFHFCMEIICEPIRELNTHEIVDPEGNVRLIFYVLVAYLADLEEQYWIAALDKSNCIHCCATTRDWSLPHNCSPRTAKSIIEAIEKVRDERHPNADPYHFALGANKHRLGDVEYPFWQSLPLVDICQALSVDLLHGFHKFFFDHPFKWNVNSLGEKEIDLRMKAQVPYSGSRVFAKGVTHITQMSMKEHRALQTVHLGVVANSPERYSRELTLATRSLLDFIYWAQLPSHSESTLKMFDQAYNEFHANKQVWIKNESRRGEAGVIEHFDIPKLHTAGHMSEQILEKGTADNFSTEVVEHLHMDTLKEAFPATNKKDWEKQTIRWLIRREKLLEFLLFQVWRKNWVSQLNAHDSVPATTSSLSNLACPQHNATQDVENNTPECSLTPTNFGSGEEPRQAEARRPRGGFSSMTSQPPPPNPTQTTTALITTKRKRKRQIDDVDDREDRTSKRILQSQTTYGLRSLQDIALKPERLTMSAVQQVYNLPNLLDDCVASSELPMPIGLETIVEVWKSIRLQEPQRRFFHPVAWTRAQACPATDKDPPVADPVLFLNRDVDTGDERKIRLHGRTNAPDISYCPDL